MEKETFIRFMNMSSSVMKDENYCVGYQYGLRRFYHGKKFGEDKIISLLRQKGNGYLQGVADGLAGVEPRIYCMKDECYCKECSYGNYILDCNNKKIYY